MKKTNQNIVYKYFQKEFGDYKVLVQVNPYDYTGLELIVHPDGKLEKTEIEADEDIYEDLAHDKFEETNALTFNLVLKGLVK
ncbi:MAG: hypothetical protein MI784_01100 [Cytophagales bacterium]|nr:hypothetical protein [Cytophagales bacterium]